MAQPIGYVDPTRPSYVCHMRKAIYGLRQAPRAWYTKFTAYLLELGFEISKADPSLFVLQTASIITYLLLYVDDIILTGNNPGFITTLLTQLGSKFAIKDLGHLHYFLGIEVQPHNGGLLLSQAKYITDLLH